MFHKQNFTSGIEYFAIANSVKLQIRLTKKRPQNDPNLSTLSFGNILPAGKVEIRVRTGHVVGEGGGVGEVVLAVVAVPVRLVPVEPLALLRFLRFV